MRTRVNLENVDIILVRPQIPENIGSVARAMHNMGLSRLTLVEPKNCDLSRVLKTATGSSVDIIEQMSVSGDLREALRPFQYTIGTTARIGSGRPAMTQPRRIAESLVSISQQNKVCIIFGPEDRGLSNEHLKFCDIILNVPTAEFSSLNLAQAVMIVSYEIFLAKQESPVESAPRLANRFELEGMYDHLKEVLMKIGFLNPQNPEHWMLSIRRFLSRMQLRAREVRVIRGICRQINWYADHVKKDSKADE